MAVLRHSVNCISCPKIRGFSRRCSSRYAGRPSLAFEPPPLLAQPVAVPGGMCSWPDCDSRKAPVRSTRELLPDATDRQSDQMKVRFASVALPVRKVCRRRKSSEGNLQDRPGTPESSRPRGSPSRRSVHDDSISRLVLVFKGQRGRFPAGILARSCNNSSLRMLYLKRE